MFSKAAVCGFEAYINDKHVIGKVKEKEKARKEYAKAVSEGHGAYLGTVFVFMVLIVL